MNRAAFAQKIHEQNVESWKTWLCDNEPKNAIQGLYAILSDNNSCSLMQQLQIRHFESKLMGEKKFATISVSSLGGIVTLDGIVTIEGDFYRPEILDYHLRSRPQFVKLIYQYMSCFPDALYEAYKEVTGENLILDDLSEVREFYKNCASFDSWTAHQLCAYISHCDPEALDFLLANPEAEDAVPKTPEWHLPTRLSRIFSRSDLYENNLPLVKAAVLGGAFELIHFDRDN